MSPFQSLRDYEHYIYTLAEQFDSIAESTLIIIQRGRAHAELSGELGLVNRHRLVIFERLIWQHGPISIEDYSYEVWQAATKLFWYDSQPHPTDPSLASTDPHHKHIPPDIKHHRVPAPGLSFTKPNLDLLISEVEALAPAP
jgi:hypothetical protein